MRLTFRAMLAYMNGVLEPEDAQEIGRKIEESEFAKNLMHRARDVVRRLRLAAPGLGSKSDLDPNTVAEYLDHTLPDERVPDFEKICLESDVQLAEVSACHQVLTLVLREAAEIEPAARERMYQLPALARTQANRASAEEPPKVAMAPAANVDDVHSAIETRTVRPRTKPTVPDYLRDPPRKWSISRVAAGLLFVFVASALVLMAFGQLNVGAVLGKLLGTPASTTDVADAASARAKQTQADAEPPAESLVDAVQQPKTTMAESVPVAADENPPAVPANRPPNEDLSSAAAAMQPTAVQPPAVQPTAEASTSLQDKRPAEAHREASLEPPLVPAPTESKEIPAAPTIVGAKQPSTPEPVADDVAKLPVETSPQPEVVVPAPQPVGQLVSDKSVLLWFDEHEKNWRRVPFQGIIASGQPLVALPTYRPLVTLTTGTAVEVRGGTRIEPMATDAAGIANLRIDYGHVRLRGTGKPDTRVRLHVGARAGVLTFGDPNAMAVVEVVPLHAPGTNPEIEPWSRTVRIYAESGPIAWFEEVGEGSTQVQSIGPGSALDAFAQPSRAPAPRDLPKWVQSEVLSNVDVLASPVVEQAMEPGHPADQTLIDLGQRVGIGRRREVRRLAIQSAGHLGEFAAAVRVLNDPDDRLDWSDYVEELVAAIARDPQTARAVAQAFEKQYGNEGAGLYRMLWGYTEKGLRAGEAETLVEQLDHKTLAYRVLSSWNLRDITGLQLYYRPEDTSLKRQPPLKAWRQRLKSGEIWSHIGSDRHEADRGSAVSPAPAEL